MKRLFLFLFFIVSTLTMYAQGYNHNWLIGNQVQFDTNTTAPKARILFNLFNGDTVGEIRKMAFWETQANISDANGSLIAATNGCWIMDATGDTMMNGSGISPGLFTEDFNSPTTGLVLPHGCIMLPYPGDTNKIVLFHQTGNYNANLSSTELYYTVIDRTLHGGLGAVIPAQKNVVVFNDTLAWGLAACKHANGRDWWIVVQKDRSNTIFKILFTSNGVVSVSSQIFNFPVPMFGNSGEPCFSPDGTKYAYTYGKPANPVFQDVRIFSFNRCTGDLDSLGYIYKSGQDGFGLCFSSNSRYLYYSSFGQVFQLDTDVPNIAGTDTLVATYDGYCYPFSFSCTNNWLMYRAANGKIYISSSQYVIDLHVINSPDNAGINCDVQQHSFRLPCYTAFGNVNHPNYYLGCDTTLGCPCLDNTSIAEQSGHNFKFRVYPNPLVNQNLNIGYLLPQNKSGVFLIYDVTGKIVFKYTLPPWSNEQSFMLPELSDGVYNCVITSGNERVSKKIAVIHE